MNFEFATATKIIFGAGVIQKLSSLIVDMGSRVMVVSGSRVGDTKAVIENLPSLRNFELTYFVVTSEPTVELIKQGVQEARQAKYEMIISIGGGSVIDAGKAIAILTMNPGEVEDYLEVVGKGHPLSCQGIPFVAIPTTAGTGSEVTRNAVLGETGMGVKVSLRSPLMLPRLALVDPQLTYSLTPTITASTGLDALTQLIEPFVSNQANPLTDAICREGMTRVRTSLRRAYQNGNDTTAREDMSLASLCGGLALANAKLGAIHGFAGPIGGLYAIPHGVVCARLLPIVMKTNFQALSIRQPDHPVLGRYDEVARILTGNPSSRAEDGIKWVKTLCEELEIPNLSQYGLRCEDFPKIIAMSSKASSMQGNPIKLTYEEMEAILFEVAG